MRLCLPPKCAFFFPPCRRDMLDEALLRPGRLEVHVEIGLPDERGRVQILQVGGWAGGRVGAHAGVGGWVGGGGACCPPCAA